MEPKRETLLSTPLFTIEHRVHKPAVGDAVERDVVVHPGAVVILPLLEGNRLVMIRNFRYTVERTLWELPAGTMEKGERAIVTASRELEEETGYQADSMEPLTEFYTSPGISTERMYAFVAKGLTWVGQHLDPSERIEVETVDLEDARRTLVAGGYEDGKTIAVLGTYFARLEGSP